MSTPLSSGKKLLLVYLALLAVSHLWQHFTSNPAPATASLIAHQETGSTDLPTLLLIHDLPFADNGWADLPELLANQFRIVEIDLPGFGQSTSEELDDYSIVEQAKRIDYFLEELDIPNAHVIAQGFGGGVALEFYKSAPQRVSSLTLISASGVQELELLGDYTLNHAVHGAQLFYIWLFYKGTPNFGLLNDARYNHAYARSYYDTDQRPLRELLGTVDIPTLLIHGEKNLRVPLAAAKEHARLVPHSETYFIPDVGKKLLPDHSAEIATQINNFITNNHRTRSDSTPERAAASTEPFDYHSYKDDLGGRIVFLIILLAIATLVSEDITCITAGLLVSQGAIGFVPASLGCFLGIFIGDTGLYLIGRILGVRALKIPPLKWFVNAQKIERSKKFFDHYGPILIVVTRWLPGMRIPTYVAAGMLRLNFLKFLIYFLCAAIIWTPALVGISTIIGERLLGWLHKFEQHALLALVLTIATVLFLVHLILALATHRGRQLLRAKWHNRLHWQRWPNWLKFAPLAPLICFLTLKHRRLVSAPEPSLHTPTVTGDGQRTLEFLILDDPSTRPDSEHFLENHSADLEEIPTKGKAIRLSPVEEISDQNYLKALSLQATKWRNQFERKNLR